MFFFEYSKQIGGIVNYLSLSLFLSIFPSCFHFLHKISLILAALCAVSFHGAFLTQLRNDGKHSPLPPPPPQEIDYYL